MMTTSVVGWIGSGFERKHFQKIPPEIEVAPTHKLLLLLTPVTLVSPLLLLARHFCMSSEQKIRIKYFQINDMSTINKEGNIKQCRR